MQRGAVLWLAALAASSCGAVCADAQTAGHGGATFGSGSLAAGTLSGIIRDTDGVPQMGALVQVLLPDSTLGATAITDSRGRYRITLAPGRYRLRATAALFLPAVKEHLQVVRGGRSVVDLTLSTLLAPTGWLPASRRSTNEPGDDWMWTLRSSASRPILRFDNPQQGSRAVNTSDDSSSTSDEPLTVSSSRQESRRGVSGGRVTLKNSDGGFARGGSHTLLLLTRVNEDGSGAVLRADLSGTRSPYPVAPSADVSVGMQRRTAMNGFSRVVLTYDSHPELTRGGGVTGMQGATLRTAQRIELGDLVRVDAGSVLRDSNIGGNAMVMEPFLRIAARAGDGVVLAYSMTRSRGTESIEDLDRVQAVMPIAVMKNGHLRMETGSHHALSVTGKVPGGGTVEVAIYRDELHNPMVSGTGSLTVAEIGAEGVIADPTTGTYRVLARDYTSTGLRASVREPVTKSLSLGAEIVSGEALKSQKGTASSLQDAVSHLSASRMYAATAYVDGKILHTGTTLRASYRVQPQRAVTAVDAFRVSEESAFLSCSVRQSLGRTGFLPRGLEAIVDVQNLLAEGYQPFVSADGQTLFLAQTPRTLQAGLSFTF